jgi:hypothetical protein
MRPNLAILIIALLLLLTGCPHQEGTAETQSKLAIAQSQTRLWQAAAKDAAASGLDKLPVVESPVVPRPRVTVQDRRVQAQPFSFPKELVAGVRVISAPELPDARFAGVARVARTEGERVDVEFGEGRVLSLHVRAGNSPLRAASNEKVRLDYRLRDDPSDRQLIVALLMQNGEGFASILETGRTPVAVHVPLFDLSAMQVGEADKNTMAVEVRVGKERKVLTQGQIVEFAVSRLSVGLVASAAYTGGAAARAEGNPYAIRIVAWPTR